MSDFDRTDFDRILLKRNGLSMEVTYDEKKGESTLRLWTEEVPEAHALVISSERIEAIRFLMETVFAPLKKVTP